MMSILSSNEYSLSTKKVRNGCALLSLHVTTVASPEPNPKPKKAACSEKPARFILTQRTDKIIKNNSSDMGENLCGVALKSNELEI